jgi:type I restriction enzyme M protein
MPRKPSWFSEETVMVSTAPTCGLTKGGRLLPVIDPISGTRVKTEDPDTGEPVDAINDSLLGDMTALAKGKLTDTLGFVPADKVSLRLAVPIYYDKRFERAFEQALESERFSGFRSASIGELVENGTLLVSGGHGSPSADLRVGDVPYIKVSDLRAGLVNINPTNRVPRRTAERFWGGKSSGLLPFDILSPERTSKNIGDFCVLMPGQQDVLLTKEILVFRAGQSASFDQF